MLQSGQLPERNSSVVLIHVEQQDPRDTTVQICRPPQFPTAQDIRAGSPGTLTATTSARTLFKWCGRSRCWAL